MRAKFIGFAFWTSLLAFVILEGDALLDQSEIGHASVPFMVGTACLAAAACIALFAIIIAIGLVVSAAFKDELPGQGPARSDNGLGCTAAHMGAPPSPSARSRPTRTLEAQK
jgi:hypothetical protein